MNMDRRTMITAAPAALLAGAAMPATAAASAGVSTDIWARWQAARSAADEAYAIETEIEKRDGVGTDSPDYRVAEEHASELWRTAFHLGRDALRTPVKTAADVIAKARVAAYELDVDDFGAQSDADVFERMYRDLAAAYGVTAEVAAILDPVIAKRDGRRAAADNRDSEWEAEQQVREQAKAERERRAIDWLKGAKAANMGVTVVSNDGKLSIACDLQHMTGENPGAVDDALADALIRLADDWRGVLKVKKIAGDLPVSVTFTQLITPTPPAA